MDKILLINLGGIGDLLICQPAIRALRQAYPAARIDITVVPRCVELVKSYGVFDTVYPFSPGVRLPGLCLRMRRNAYDAAVNMRSMTSWQAALKMFCIFWLINPRIRIGRDTGGRGFFYDIRIPEAEPSNRYAMEYDLDASRALGAEVKDRSIHFTVSAQDRQRLDALLQGFGVRGDQPLVVMHPGGMPSRRWPIANFLKVCLLLQEKSDAVFVITGSREESRLAKILIGASGLRCIDLTGSLEIGELAALINRCAVFISNDTGPMHLAAALGVRQIAIFGPGDLVQFDPRQINPRAVVFYRKTVACSPCNKQGCSSLACLRAISPQEVAQAAQEMLRQRT